MTKIIFCPVRAMSLASGKSKDSLDDLRANGTLKKGIHWIADPSSGRVLWNHDLVIDWLVNGHSPEHQRAIERYLGSLPSSIRPNVGGSR